MLRPSLPQAAEPASGYCGTCPPAWHMQRPRRRCRVITVAAAIVCLSTIAELAVAQVQEMTGKLLDDVEIAQRPGSQVPLDLRFRNSEDQPVQLRQLFRGKPVVLNLVYYRCPRLCKMTTAGLLRTLRAMELKAGQQFDILTISFNPRETASDARAARRTALSLYEQSSAEQGWHFLTGDAAAIEPLLKAVGFQVAYDGNLDQYAHAAGLVILTPEGRVSRYLNGVEFAARDLRLALVEASASKIGTITDQVLLFCYEYNPKIGKYSFAVHSLLQGLGICTVLVLGGSIAWMLRRERIANGPGGLGAASDAPHTSDAAEDPKPPPRTDGVKPTQ